jgi:hypothetical protein
VSQHDHESISASCAALSGIRMPCSVYARVQSPGRPRARVLNVNESNRRDLDGQIAINGSARYPERDEGVQHAHQLIGPTGGLACGSRGA